MFETSHRHHIFSWSAVLFFVVWQSQHFFFFFFCNTLHNAPQEQIRAALQPPLDLARLDVWFAATHQERVAMAATILPHAAFFSPSAGQGEKWEEFL